MNIQQNNRGFTLIELVVVIAILAILAAFALPRFAQLSEEAHRSSVKATAGALAAGVALVKAQNVTNGSTGATLDVDGFGNGLVDNYQPHYRKYRSCMFFPILLGYLYQLRKYNYDLHRHLFHLDFYLLRIQVFHTMLDMFFLSR